MIPSSAPFYQTDNVVGQSMPYRTKKHPSGGRIESAVYHDTQTVRFYSAYAAGSRGFRKPEAGTWIKEQIHSSQSWLANDEVSRSSYRKRVPSSIF